MWSYPRNCRTTTVGYLEDKFKLLFIDDHDTVNDVDLSFLEQLQQGCRELVSIPLFLLGSLLHSINLIETYATMQKILERIEEDNAILTAFLVSLTLQDFSLLYGLSVEQGVDEVRQRRKKVT